MKKTACLILCLILPLFCLSRPAAGKVYIDILSPAFQKFPVAIPDFAPLPGSETTGSLAAEIPGRLSGALELTGFFRVVDRNAYLESPDTPEGEIRFSDWRAVGSEYLVRGGFQENGETLSIEFRLYDVVEGRLLAGKRYTGKRKDEKAMVYRMAGEVLLTLTGDEGVFNTEIVFTGKKNRFSDLYAVQFDGSNLRRLTNTKTITILPRWSGDGTKIAYTNYTRGNPDLYVLSLSTGASKCISSKGGLNVSGGWSPDGTRMLLVSSRDGNEEIYVLDPETGNSTRLTRDPAIDVSPSWSPDGRKIAFVSGRSGTPQIFLMEADGSGVRRLTFEGNYNSSPAWSPSGSRIAYEGRTNGQFQIFTIDETGRNNVQLTYENGGAESPSWSPDGRFIAFQGKRNGKGSIAVINANGLNLRVLHDGKDLDASSPAWSPRLNLY